MTDIDDAIDRLYQIGLDAFVAERNALAKAAKRPDVKALEKPAAPAWAVNQLYWRQRAVFDRLVAASEAVRAAHRALLTGQPADVRAAEAAHRDAMREAQSVVRTALSEAGVAASPSTLEAIGRTLEALPHVEANGRLTKPLTPQGLDALAGLTLAPPREAARVLAMPSPPAASGADATNRAADAARRAEARAERRRAAEEEVRAAQVALVDADARLEEAERDLAARRRDRDAARDRVAAALAAVRSVDDFE